MEIYVGIRLTFLSSIRDWLATDSCIHLVAVGSVNLCSLPSFLEFKEEQKTQSRYNPIHNSQQMLIIIIIIIIKFPCGSIDGGPPLNQKNEVLAKKTKEKKQICKQYTCTALKYI